ncbi:MAG: ABC transporter permease [Spirochaetales bacterium]
MSAKQGNRKQWLRVAWRNITRQKKRTLLLGGAIGFAVLIITLVNAYTGGLVVAIRENFTQTFGGHVYVSGSVVSESGREVEIIQEPQVLDEAVDAAGIEVREINYRSGSLATLIYTSNEVLQIVDGVNFEREERFREVTRLVEGSWEELSQPGSILLPVSLAEQLGITLGEQLILSVNTITGQRNVIDLTLRGVAAEVAGLGITSAYVQLADMNRALGLEPGEYQTANLYLNDASQIDRATEAVRAALGERAPVEPPPDEGDGAGPMAMMARIFGGGGGEDIEETDRWQGTRFALSNLNDATEQLESVIGTVNAVAFGIFVVLLVITAVGITNSYRMVMIERTQEIGTMRSIGVTQSGIRWIFSLEAILVALVGTLAGLAFSGVIIGVLSAIQWSAGTALGAFLVQGRLQADLALADITISVVAILLMTLWAVSSPAKQAARLEPAQALRTTY